MSFSGTGLRSPDLLAEEINVITKNYPDALIAGSIGRAGLYGHLIDDPEYEYRRRDQHPTQTYRGGIADIDLINAPASITSHQLVFGTDLDSLGGRQVSLKRVDGNWLLLSKNRDFVANLDDRVMEPTLARTVYNARCKTLPAQTHYALLGITGTVREQDVVAQEILSEAIIKSGIPLLPDELYEPFRELFELNYESTMATARRAYRTILPLSVRRVLAPTMKKVKDRHLK
jgi:hypothetical protein